MNIQIAALHLLAPLLYGFVGYQLAGLHATPSIEVLATEPDVEEIANAANHSGGDKKELMEQTMKLIRIAIKEELASTLAPLPEPLLTEDDIEHTEAYLILEQAIKSGGWGLHEQEFQNQLGQLNPDELAAVLSAYSKAINRGEVFPTGLLLPGNGNPVSREYQP